MRKKEADERDQMAHEEHLMLAYLEAEKKRAADLE